ncbi:MAG TPA: hypothetical protein VGB85_22345 [Nannocystis sp.]
MSLAPLLLLASLSLMFAGLVLLIEREHDELSELCPAELSTSAPVPRSCWERIQERVRHWRAPQPRRRRRSGGPRQVVLEMAEISAARRLFCGRVADLGSRPGAWES